MNILPLNQYFTYWPATSVDANGQTVWGAGIAVKCRWAKRDGIVVGEGGNDQKAEHVIFTTLQLPKRCMITLDNQNAAAQPPVEARLLLVDEHSPSISSLKEYMV